MIATNAAFRDLALLLILPEVTDTTAWGHPCLKGHGKMWCWCAQSGLTKAGPRRG